MHTTQAHQQETDLNFLRNFRTASNVKTREGSTLHHERLEREAPYIMTNVSAPPELRDPRHLIPPVAPHVYNRSLCLPFTAPIVPQLTPARVSYGHTLPMTAYFMTNTPARIRSSPTHSLMNGIGIANQTIVET